MRRRPRAAPPALVAVVAMLRPRCRRGEVRWTFSSRRRRTATRGSCRTCARLGLCATVATRNWKIPEACSLRRALGAAATPPSARPWRCSCGRCRRGRRARGGRPGGCGSRSWTSSGRRTWRRRPRRMRGSGTSRSMPPSAPGSRRGSRPRSPRRCTSGASRRHSRSCTGRNLRRLGCAASPPAEAPLRQASTAAWPRTSRRAQSPWGSGCRPCTMGARTSTRTAPPREASPWQRVCRDDSGSQFGDVGMHRIPTCASTSWW
mmetsp:Transcript_122630/g.392545  ORF Transcript_122630/g.392545 Transcript_122630/m.392545 type:complete len:262 (-) Transcript_122630:86-871(-)